LPEYNNIGSAITALDEFKKPLNISTVSFTIFSFKTVDIKVVFAPDNATFTVVFVTSVSSVNVGTVIKKADAEYVLLDPDTDEVMSKEASVKLTGVEKPIDTR
tara:strand:+ start:43 stop:351 length:309 start_codon:yes stop_codon:yes gene_type:complete